MTVFNSSNASPALIVQNVQMALKGLRKAFDDVASLYAWSSGVSVADLTAIGFSASDASDLLSAVADAHAEYVLRTTGQPPSTYPQAASGYVYAASQTRVIGPSAL